MSLISSFNKIFRPDPNEAARRRLKVFGTTSKKVAATVIVGTAAAAIAAPVVIGAQGARTAATAVARAAAANPLKTTVIGAVAAPIIAGSVVRDPTIVSRAPYEVANFSSDLYEAAKNPSFESFKEVIEESPLLSAGTGLLVAGTGAASLISAGRNLLQSNTPEIKLPDGAFISTIPSSQTVSSGSPIPLTPQTQVIGRETGRTSIARRKVRKVKKQASVNVRVYNQNAFIVPRVSNRYG